MSAVAVAQWWATSSTTVKRQPPTLYRVSTANSSTSPQTLASVDRGTHCTFSVSLVSNDPPAPLSRKKVGQGAIWPQLGHGAPAEALRSTALGAVAHIKRPLMPPAWSTLSRWPPVPARTVCALWLPTAGDAAQHADGWGLMMDGVVVGGVMAVAGVGMGAVVVEVVGGVVVGGVVMVVVVGTVEVVVVVVIGVVAGVVMMGLMVLSARCACGMVQGVPGGLLAKGRGLLESAAPLPTLVGLMLRYTTASPARLLLREPGKLAVSALWLRVSCRGSGECAWICGQVHARAASW